MLESRMHESSLFATLTYDEEHRPEGDSLSVRDAQLFLKRLRALCPTRIRFYLVGEYGDSTQRPHYHAALFGVSAPALVDQAWALGYTFCGVLTPQSAAYIAGYVTKKMTSREDPRLKGRQPEFARMSLRPGIGAHAVDQFAKPLVDADGVIHLDVDGDVPSQFRTEGKLWPLGRYLKGRLRGVLGVDRIAVGARLRARQGACPVAAAAAPGVTAFGSANRKRALLRQAKSRDSFNRSKKGL